MWQPATCEYRGQWHRYDRQWRSQNIHLNAVPAEAQHGNERFGHRQHFLHPPVGPQQIRQYAWVVMGAKMTCRAVE